MAPFTDRECATGCLTRESTEGSLSDWVKAAQTPSADTLSTQAEQAAGPRKRPAQPDRAPPGAPASQEAMPKTIATFGPAEEPGSGRSQQQWLMKLEYQGMQKKGILQKILHETERTSKAVRCAERRQDRSSGFPEDFIRHWRESESKDRCLAAASQIQHHFSQGVCCLPGCLVFLGQLWVGKASMKEHEQRAELEELQRKLWEKEL